MRVLLPLLLILALAGCYQGDGPVLAEGAQGPVKDGVWRRADGGEVELAWDGSTGGYRVGAGGVVRLAKAGELWLADYQAERDIVLLAKLTPEQVVLVQPKPEAEQRLLATHKLALKAGPIRLLSGSAAERRSYLAAAATLPESDLVEVGRLTWMAAR
ncbi:MAG TPA: hypothetical protein VL974_02295 [Magnetospirillum sp.]|jgi:hypothetical protein|nr:hypothetical protein [Magnetospirillum sp.]